MTTIDIMIDLETMGSGPDAAIVSIGACAMSVERGIYSQFYSPVSLKSSVKHGGRIDADTVLWWLRQSEAARASLTDPAAPPTHIIQALGDLSDWMGSLAPEVNDRRVWGNGADFDLPILASAYRGIGEAAPWPYFGSRCFRTIKNLHRHIPAPARHGTHHQALDDAVHQAEHWLAIMRSIPITATTPQAVQE